MASSSVINEAIRNQLDQVSHVTSLGMSHPVTIALAKRLVDLCPIGLEHVFFSSDGASAVEVALKMAFQYWRQIKSPDFQRTTFLAVGNAYHGDTIGAVSVGAISQFHAMFQPLLFPVLRGPCPDPYRFPNDGVEGGISKSTHCSPAEKTEYYLARYRKILEQHASQIAAIIVEPIVLGAAGMVVQPPGFLHGICQLAQEFNTLLIADEVAVGIGRTGKMFACEHEQVSPDFLCLGKGLTGGYLPMSATVTKTKIWNAFLGDHSDQVTFFHGHTYAGNPLSAAAAMATLDVFEQERTLESLPTKAEQFRAGFQSLSEHPNVGDIRQKGLMVAIELVSDKATKTPYPSHERRGARACRRSTGNGVWLRPLGNNIVLIPPLSISHDEIDFMIRTVYDAVDFATNTPPRGIA